MKDRFLPFAPIDGILFSDTAIETQGGFRTIQLWPGTEHERGFLDFSNERIAVHRYTFQEDGTEESRPPISLDDYDEVNHLEMITYAVILNSMSDFYCALKKVLGYWF